jgi:hypothetical protein
MGLRGAFQGTTAHPFLDSRSIRGGFLFIDLNGITGSFSLATAQEHEPHKHLLSE